MNIILIGNELETPCLMTTSYAFSNTHDTHYEFFFTVFSLTKTLHDLHWLFENPRFFNVVSNNNVYVTPMIHISLWRKVFHHDDWWRRWLILHWVQEWSNTRLKFCFLIFLTWTNRNIYSFHHDSRKWFLKSTIYQSFSLAWLESTFQGT
jgi:hypothetical protein